MAKPDLPRNAHRDLDLSDHCKRFAPPNRPRRAAAIQVKPKQNLSNSSCLEPV